MNIKRRDLISVAVGVAATIVIGGAIVGFSSGEHGWGDDHRRGEHRMGHDGDFGVKLGMSNRPLGPGNSVNNGMMGGPGQNPGGPLTPPSPAPTK
jgi:hypothetical protein